MICVISVFPILGWLNIQHKPISIGTWCINKLRELLMPQVLELSKCKIPNGQEPQQLLVQVQVK